MARNKRGPSGPHALTLAQQIGAMKASWPTYDCRLKRNTLVIRGPARPTPICHEYRVRVQYPLGRAVRVDVEDPHLRPREPGGKIPHVYGGDQPCLYLPKLREWRPSMAIADTIVPWLFLWLFHYEIWHATGEWLGGGVHPPSRRARRRRRR